MNAFRTSLLTALLLLAASAVAADSYPNHTSQRLREVPDAAVEVEIWTDRGDGSRYCAGDEIEVYFRTTADAWVAIYDVDTRGRVQKLFPSRHAADNFVRGHRTYRVPARYGTHFEIEGPTGWETLRAVASTDRHALRDYRFRDLRVPPAHRPYDPDDRRHDRDRDRDDDWDSDWDSDRRGRYTPASQPVTSRPPPATERLREVPDGPPYPHSPILSVAETRHFVRDGYRCRAPRPWWHRR